MAPSRGKGKVRAAANSTTRQSTTSQRAGSGRARKNEARNVYQDMLAEAATTEETSDRPLKRRKVVTHKAGPPDHVQVDSTRSSGPSRTANGKAREQQTMEASSDEDDSDFGFEDVDLARPSANSPGSTEDDAIADVSISLDTKTTPKRQARAKRKGTSLADKAYRLLVHKAHVLCLLGHCIYINSWCNNDVVHQNLEAVLPEKVKFWLRGSKRDSQFDRNRFFLQGLQDATETFRGRFKVVSSGMRRATWVTEGDEAELQADVEPLDRADFIRASKRLEGSQDTGNQLFCALLRAIDVEARVVCSLQVLPFASVATKSTPQKVVKRTIYASDAAMASDNTASDASMSDGAVGTSTMIGKIPSVRRRLGQPSFVDAPASPKPMKDKQKSVRKLAYPVFWTEAFNAAYQKWVAVDPIVTGTVNKPTKLEPPSAYDMNQLSYVIAFEDDGVARDVTRRYAKAYNAKTRRQRVESTENGTLWFKQAMRIFRRRDGALDRDQVEDAELAQKEAREGLPSNVQDFKDHPYYALERHMLRHEVIQPKREVGKVNAGTAANPRMEAVYRRQDVHQCRSADKWFRLGREVKSGEQPLKHVVSRRSRREDMPEDGDAGQEANTTALYAAHQTELYVPPPVVRGRVPRNGFGNLDIYVPSMVPAGGMHVKHPLTQQAAKILHVDYADAVTGFTFRGRQGTAVIQGAVVASQYAEAIEVVVEGLDWQAEEDRCRQRSLVALRMWARMLKGLRIAERVSGYRDKDAEGAVDAPETAEENEPVVLPFAIEDEPLWTAGKFSIDELVAPSGPGRTRKRKTQVESEEEAEMTGDETASEYGGQERATRHSTRNRRKVVYDQDDENDDEGDYAPEDADEDGAGGFVVEDAMETDVDGNRAGGSGVDDTAQPDAQDDSGGFLLDDESHAAMEHVDSRTEDDTGGGFLVDDGGADSNVRIVADHNVDTRTEDDTGGGFLVDDGDAGSNVGLVADNIPAAVGIFMPHHDRRPTLVEESGDLSIEMKDLKGRRASPEDGNGACEVACAAAETVAVTDVLGTENPELVNTAGDRQNMDEDSENDNGSLISHDPEDDDAEPDWLESD